MLRNINKKIAQCKIFIFRKYSLQQANSNSNSLTPLTECFCGMTSREAYNLEVSVGDDAIF